MKTVIIGAGASGLVCAITLARRNIDVTVVDKLNDNGKKILVTGNGRCNYWNEDFDNRHFYSSNMDFIKSINTLENRESVLKFFNSVGIIPSIKNGYYYPMSMQAKSIRDALLLEANKLGVNFINNFNVIDIKEMNNRYTVVSENEEIKADKLIIAAGSYSYYRDKTSIYDILKKLGHTIKPVLPSLVQLVGNDSFYKDWAGVRSNVNVSLLIDNKNIKEEYGEIMLTDYGVSGICIFNLSGYANRALYNNKKVKILINFLPEIKDLNSFLEQRGSILNNQLKDFFIGLLNDKLIDIILKRCNLNGNSYWNQLSNDDKNKLVNTISSFEVNIISSKSYDNSQVCTGGVDTEEINNTMESKLKKNLYLIGEVLDIDGECGGYNLGLAWLTGIIAGRSVNSD